MIPPPMPLQRDEQPIPVTIGSSTTVLEGCEGVSPTIEYLSNYPHEPLPTQS